eukprot:GHVN01085864.1.p1 GENE.GHVN01085864.1~~GHVN01085864.1.p1  ORF type:complete len:387 (-),score=66.15 GHVN01085864.1:359-1519(-)
MEKESTEEHSTENVKPQETVECVRADENVEKDGAGEKDREVGEEKRRSRKRESQDSEPQEEDSSDDDEGEESTRKKTKSARTAKGKAKRKVQAKAKQKKEAEPIESDLETPDPVELNKRFVGQDGELLTTKETTPDELKIVSWNVNGLRSVLKPSPFFGGKHPLIEYVSVEKPHVLFINEIKLNQQIEHDFDDALPGYKGKAFIAEQAGYAGVSVYWRTDSITPVKVEAGIGHPTHDEDGRTVTLELDDAILVGTYVANSGRGLVKLDYRVNEFDPAMRGYLLKKSETLIPNENKSASSRYKDVIWCGDLNVAHEVKDIWNSKGNQKSAGHTPQERWEVSNWLLLTFVSRNSFAKMVQGENAQFVDVYRAMYPKRVEYTYWAATFV